MNLPLSHLKVVELAEYISGPYSGMLLTGFGAEVLKIESPLGGDISRRCGPFPNDIPDMNHSGLFHYLNRNKKGVTLDVKKTSGREIFFQLLKEADVCIMDLLPCTAEKLGLLYQDVQEVNQDCIVVSITPFGLSGPYKDYKAYAINASAIGGMSTIVGEPDREPLTPPFSLGNFQTGVITANAVMSALMAKKKGGGGQHVDISEAESWAIFHTGNVVSAFIYSGRKRNRSGHRTFAPYPYTLLPCKDGYISMIALRGSEWKRFLEIVGDGQIPEWYAGDERFQDRAQAGAQYAEVLDELLSPWLMSHTREQIFQLCRDKSVPFTPVRNMSEIVNCEHLNTRQYFEQIQLSEENVYKCPGAPVRFSKSSWHLEKRGPTLSEDNQEIFCERLGYARQELAQLKKMGII